MHSHSERSIPNCPPPDPFYYIPASLCVTTFTDGEFTIPGGISFPLQTVLIINVRLLPEPFPSRFYCHPNTLPLKSVVHGPAAANWLCSAERQRETSPQTPVSASLSNKPPAKPPAHHSSGSKNLQPPSESLTQLTKHPSLPRRALVSVAKDVRISRGRKD